MSATAKTGWFSNLFRQRSQAANDPKELIASFDEDYASLEEAAKSFVNAGGHPMSFALVEDPSNKGPNVNDMALNLAPTRAYVHGESFAVMAIIGEMAKASKFGLLSVEPFDSDKLASRLVGRAAYIIPESHRAK